MDKNLLGQLDYCNLRQEVESLSFNAVGEEYCKPGHFNGPKIREHYLFHFIVSGKGKFQINDKTYHLSENQGFLIADSSIVYYEADLEDPWHYCWLSIQGKAAKTFFDHLSLSASKPIYTATSGNTIYPQFKKLLEVAKNYQITPYTALSALYNCLLTLQTSNSNTKNINKVSSQEQYVREAENYIASNYHRENLRIEDIADHIGINRSYFTRLFTQYHGESPQKYLVSFRMQKAKGLLFSTTSPVNVIAYSVGYTDVFIFSKAYKKYFGISPSGDRTKYLKHSTPETV